MFLVVATSAQTTFKTEPDFSGSTHQQVGTTDFIGLQDIQGSVNPIMMTYDSTATTNSYVHVTDSSAHLGVISMSNYEQSNLSIDIDDVVLGVDGNGTQGYEKHLRIDRDYIGFYIDHLNIRPIVVSNSGYLMFQIPFYADDSVAMADPSIPLGAVYRVGHQLRVK